MLLSHASQFILNPREHMPTGETTVTSFLADAINAALPPAEAEDA